MWRFVIWQLYWLAVITLFVVAYWRTAPKETISKVNEFILVFYPTILGIGTVALISFLALLTTIISINYSEIRENSNRRVQAELKISEFRQQWIKELREEIALFSKLCFASAPQSTFSEEDIDEIFGLMMRVRLKLNLNEELASALWTNMNLAFASACSYQPGDSQQDRKNSMETSQNQLAASAQAFLKNEWDRLKSDIENAQISKASV